MKNNVGHDNGPLRGDEFQVSKEKEWVERCDCRFSEAFEHFISPNRPNHRVDNYDNAAWLIRILFCKFTEAGKYLCHVTTRGRDVDVSECYGHGREARICARASGIAICKKKGE